MDKLHVQSSTLLSAFKLKVRHLGFQGSIWLRRSSAQHGIKYRYWWNNHGYPRIKTFNQ